MTEPEPELEQPEPPAENEQLWRLTIHAEAEVIPGSDTVPEED